jgi:predicted metalloprotease with PDZ domain
LAEALAEWVHGRAELPLANAWAAAGVSLGREALTPWAATWGLRVTETPSGVLVKSVLSGGAAAQAGLSAGDEILAVQGWRVRHLEDARAWCRPGEVVQLLLNRQQRITQVVLQMPLIDAPAAQQATLSLAAAPEVSALQLRQGWLGV